MNKMFNESSFIYIDDATKTFFSPLVSRNPDTFAPSYKVRWKEKGKERCGN